MKDALTGGKPPEPEDQAPSFPCWEGSMWREYSNSPLPITFCFCPVLWEAKAERGLEVLDQELVSLPL